MSRPIAALRNLGPATARDLELVGIVDEKSLREAGAIEAFRRLKALKPRHYSVVGFWALHAALMDGDWRALPDSERERLRAAADRLKRPGGGKAGDANRARHTAHERSRLRRS